MVSDSDLSPAQAVWVTYEQILENECVVTDTDKRALAAAIRAAADQVVPEQLAEPRGTGFRWGGWAAKQWVRNRLLAIADELETL